MRFPRRSWIIPLITTALSVSVLSAAQADCQPNGTAADDTIICSGDDANGIQGAAGSDTITVQPGATVNNSIIGDTVLIGPGGNDTIINYGSVTGTGVDAQTGLNGDIEGDVVLNGNGGNDLIINYGSVAGDIDGDTADGDGGDDVIINYGVVGDDLDGDDVTGQGGDDQITNAGVVNGDIDASGGDDRVTLMNGASGGADHALYIDGGDGSDVLVFAFVVNSPQDYDALSAQIAAAQPSGGSITIHGETFTWANFEQLVSLLTVAQSSGGTITITAGQQTIRVVFTDGRINDGDAAATAALYCTSDGGIAVFGIDESSQGIFLYAVTDAQVASALAQAANTGENQVIAGGAGQALWALTSGELQLHDAEGRYDFILAADRCG
ncbi:MAG: hypothetical protein JNM70_08605 [Anaerolineae bacterium]|nr:hypothetical protein [Anaerolineae bacterium]